MMKGHYREVVGCSRNLRVHDFLCRWGQGKAQIDSQSVAITFGLAGKLEGTFLPEGSVVIRWRLLFVMNAHALPT
jgi:hypothetical protein